jgi:MoxR-like ATPase
VELKKVMKTMLYTPGLRGHWGLPLYFRAAPGTAKSHLIEDLSVSLGMPHVENLSPGERGEGAFGVVPVPDRNGDGKFKLAYPPPEWFFSMEKGGLVFIDEINRAPHALQPYLLGLVNDRRVGGAYLGDHVRVLAAMNPADTAAGVWDLDSAVANRAGHMTWPAPEAEQWVIYMVAGANNSRDDDEKPIVMETEEKRVMKLWPDHWAQSVGAVTAFIRSRRDLLHMEPKQGDPSASAAWPSHRTWELATRALAGADLHGCTNTDQEEIVASFVGIGASNEFFTFREKQDLPNPADVLDGKEKFKHDGKRLDRTSAVLSSCAALVAPPTCIKRIDRANMLWTIMSEVAKDAADVIVPAAQVLVRSKLSGKSVSAATPVLVKLAPILSAAGISD